MRLEINPKGIAALVEGSQIKDLNIWVDSAVFDYHEKYMTMVLTFSPRFHNYVSVEFKLYGNPNYPKVKVLGASVKAYGDGEGTTNEQFLEDFAEMAKRLKMWFKVEHNGDGFEVVNAKDYAESDLEVLLEFYNATANVAHKYLRYFVSDDIYNAY